MQRRAARVDLSKQLLVEGRDEELFFRAFLRHLEIDGVQVQGYMGKRNLGNFLIELVDSVGFDRVESIGIVRDADDSAASGLQSIQSHFAERGVAGTADVPGLCRGLANNLRVCNAEQCQKRGVRSPVPRSTAKRPSNGLRYRIFSMC